MPENLQNSWVRLTLGDLGRFNTSSVDKLVQPHEDPVSLINYMDVYRHRHISSDLELQTVTASTEERTRYQVQKGDVLFTPSSETPDDIAHSAVVAEELSDTLHSYHTVRLRPDGRVPLDVRFSGYFANSEVVRRYFSQRAAGSTRYTLSLDSFRRAVVDLPPVDQQQRIAEILSTVDEAIEQTEALIAKTQQIKAGLMHDLFTRGVTADGQLRPPREEAPQLYKESPLGWIPKEWEIAPIGRIADFVTSGSRGWAAYYADEGVMFVRIGNLTREHPNLRLDVIAHVQPPTSSEGARTRLVEGDVLISITADLGIVGVVPPEFGEAYINQHIALVRPKRALAVGRWLGHWLGGAQAQARFRRLDDPGAKAGLNLPTIRSFPAVLPPKEERDETVSSLDAVDAEICCARESAAKLRQLKQGLMQDLLTGRVPVMAEASAEVAEVTANV